MSGIRAISCVVRVGTLAAVATLALALAACTSTTTVVKVVGGGSGTGSAPAKTSAPASASAKPSPTGPTVTITPGSGVKSADPTTGITVTASGGTLKNVTVATSGDPVTGTYSAGRTAWHSEWTLDVAQSYTVTATATATSGTATSAAAGTTTTTTSAFRTLTPANTFSAEIFEGAGETYGVGMPITLDFSRPVKDKAAVERSIELTTSKRVVGAWYWDGNSTLDFRPRDFWPAHTTVSFTGHFDGVQAAPGLYGNHTLTQTFVIGQSVIAVASTQTHRTQIYVNGKLTYNWPISTGRGTLPTPDGSYLAVDKNNPVRMIGGTKGTAGYYNELVNWAVRFTFSGDYYHSAPWSVVDQGTTNVSHGCVNLPPADAEIYYKLAVPGDPITVTGSSRPGTWDNGWTEWFLSWNQLLSGSALGEAVVAGPQGSVFVRPSTLRPNTAKTPLGTARAGNNLS
jgi:lipoprotein-anchoring transpeptidase ErfK/SrfK